MDTVAMEHENGLLCLLMKEGTTSSPKICGCAHRVRLGAELPTLLQQSPAYGKPCQSRNAFRANLAGSDHRRPSSGINSPLDRQAERSFAPLHEKMVPSSILRLIDDLACI